LSSAGLPGGALIAYTLLQRDWALWRRLHLASGAMIFLAIAVPWFAAVSLRNHEFFAFFFIHEHFTRFLTSEHRREGSWWYFVPIFVVGILPWLIVFAWTARRMWVSAIPAANGFSWQRFALVWSAFIFVFFSASGSKLPSYILPMFPVLALLSAWLLVRAPMKTLERLTLPMTLAIIAGLVIVLIGWEPLARRFVTEEVSLEPSLAFEPWIRGRVRDRVRRRHRRLVVARPRRARAVLAGLASLAWTQIVLTGYDELAGRARPRRSSSARAPRAARACGPALLFGPDVRSDLAVSGPDRDPKSIIRTSWRWGSPASRRKRS
jgi:4-amino-4-deoxy-L-arabinose transferase-like glycosyltransferase